MHQGTEWKSEKVAGCIDIYRPSSLQELLSELTKVNYWLNEFPFLAGFFFQKYDGNNEAYLIFVAQVVDNVRGAIFSDMEKFMFERKIVHFIWTNVHFGQKIVNFCVKIAQFMWRKFQPQILSIENKWQIWGMQQSYKIKDYKTKTARLLSMAKMCQKMLCLKM